MNPRLRERTARPIWWPRWAQPLWEFLNRDVWSVELGGLPTFRRAYYRLSRIVYLAVRGFHGNHCMFRASGLAFITVLSLVPLLAVAFSVAKGLGAYERLRTEVIDPLLDRTFEASAGADAIADGGSVRAAIDQVLEFVQGTNVGNLGTLGLLALIYTVIKLLGTIEQTLNLIWGVRRPRSWVRKFADYLSMVVIVPILLVSATAFATSMRSQRVNEWIDKVSMGSAWEQVLGLGTIVALWLGFAFVYLFMPNTRVRVKSALLGGIVGGTLWWLIQMGHVGVQVNVAKYNALYSGLAAIPLFLVWVYLSWVTVLVGAELAYAHQNEPAYRQLARAREFDHPLKQVVATRAMARIAAAFLRGDMLLRPQELSETLSVPEHTLNEVFDCMVQAHLLAYAEDDFEEEGAVLPARDLDHIRIQDVYDALNGKVGSVEWAAADGADRAIDALRLDFEVQRAGLGGNVTLRELGESALKAWAASPESGVAPDGPEPS
ncbi:MAG: YihY/virulence factor BrkB family protein [Planctomycetes bacterium]|nr:YihY/virulence factor BrkB family protein [Planctomycetota bacterium]